jgi:ribosomal protein S18 acetylase RimI-like enzyme
MAPPNGRVRVARLTAADVAPYRDLMLHGYAQSPDAFTSTAEERAAEPDAWWLDRIADPAGLHCAVGAFAPDGALVGSVALEFSAKPKTRHRAHLIGMFVQESRRRLGAGRALVDAALALVRERRAVLVVTLTVTEGNVAAVALYRSFGFEPFGVEPMAIRTAGGFRSKLHMWLPLAPSEIR